MELELRGCPPQFSKEVKAVLGLPPRALPPVPEFNRARSVQNDTLLAAPITDEVSKVSQWKPQTGEVPAYRHSGAFQNRGQESKLAASCPSSGSREWSQTIVSY